MCTFIKKNMTTFAQYIYITANPDKSHDFEDNEDFEQFRDNLLIMQGMSIDKVDAEIFTPTTSKPKVVTSGTIYRRAYNVLRRRLKGTTQLSDIKRLLLNEICECSKQLGDIEDDELIIEWNTYIKPLLDQKELVERYKTLDSILTKMNTLSGKGSKTMENFLRATKEEARHEVNEEEADDSDNSSFRIPK